MSKAATEVQADTPEESSGNVIFLDPLNAVPEPKLPLKEVGRKTYDERCDALLKRGLLTINTKDLVEMLAVADDALHMAITNGGKNLRAAAEMKRSALLKLDKLDADKIVITPGQGKSDFAKFGFAKRARQRHLDTD